jgi:hypothetical protein
MTRASRALLAFAVLGAAVAFAACSLIQNVDDIVVGHGIPEAGETAASDASTADANADTSLDAGADAATDVSVDASAEGSTDAPACDPRWACWPMPTDTPTNYVEGGAPGIVVDGLTLLQWQAAVGDAGIWDQAKTDCLSLDAGGTGWRLPTRIELVSLLTLSNGVIPAIDQSAFPSTPAAPYWTSSTLAAGGVFIVDFDSGTVRTDTSSASYYHRCVRAP